MKHSIIFTTMITLALTSQLVSAGSISDPAYATGDPLTATKMNNIRTAVNDNNAQVSTNITDIVTLDAIVGDVQSAQASQIKFTKFGYAWADQPSSTTPYTPSPTYSFNSSGGAITISRTSTGKYTVLFKGISGNNGTVTVTAYGSTNTCNVQNWNGTTDWSANVTCVSVSGVFVNSLFTINVMSMQ